MSPQWMDAILFVSAHHTMDIWVVSALTFGHKAAEVTRVQAPAWTCVCSSLRCGPERGTAGQMLHPRSSVAGTPRIVQARPLFFFLTVLGLAAQDLSPAVGAGATLWWGRRGLTSRRLLLLWRQVLGMRAPAVAARGFQSAGSVVAGLGLSCFAACGIFPDQGLNPCPLHWQAGSQPLDHQGSPPTSVFKR